MKVIGLTGGIACGKSTVAKELASQPNVVVIDSDAIARDIWEKGHKPYHKLRKFLERQERYKHRIEEIFNEGANIVDDKVRGTVNRPVLGSIVFNDAQVRSFVNKTGSGWIYKQHLRRIYEQWKRSNLMDDLVIVLDTPLLFEAPIFRYLASKVIVVYTPADRQKELLMKRNNLSEEEALSRMNAQMSLEKKVKMADFVINNTGSLDELKREAAIQFESCREVASHFGTSTLHNIMLIAVAISVTYAAYVNWHTITRKSGTLSTQLPSKL